MTIFDGNVASMAVTGGQVGLMIGRTMHRSSDGLNHQGGIAVVFDADTLQVRSNLGQTSGHSFENVLTVVGNEFVGIDLGDNYPRGVNLHRFSDGKRDANVVFTFKTQHGTEPQSPAGAAYPVYPQISGAQTYYQWSNDNATYTELGGVVDDGAGITVVFASESVRGRALDNSRVGSGHNDPRNIGLVRVQRDLAKFQYGGNVLKDEQVLTSGAVESGGFYTFGGYWSEQRNAGVVWLTDYRDKDRANASRVRAAALADGTLLILWEQWTADRYVATWGQRVDAFGQPRSAAVNLGSVVRLGRRDDVLVRGQDVHIFAGRAAERALDVIVIRTGTV